MPKKSEIRMVRSFGLDLVTPKNLPLDSIYRNQSLILEV